MSQSSKPKIPRFSGGIILVAGFVLAIAIGLGVLQTLRTSTRRAAVSTEQLQVELQAPDSSPTSRLVERETTSSPNVTHTPIENSRTDVLLPVSIVRQHLAQSLNVDPSEITIKEVEPVTWPDTCLGLPAPELCAPGPTKGLRIRLRTLSATYTYHTDMSDTFRYAGPGDMPMRP